MTAPTSAGPGSGPIPGLQPHAARASNPHQQIHVLVQDASQRPNVSRHPEWGVPVYYGGRLPALLQPYAAPAHSLERYAMGVLNGDLQLPAQSTPAPRPTPRLYAHQRPQVEVIHTAFRQDTPGFLLVYPTGGGKTGMAVAGLRDLPGERILVITKRDIVPGWRRAIDFFGAGGKQWVVINPERLWRLFEHPSYPLAGLPPDDAAEVAAWTEPRCPAKGRPHRSRPGSSRHKPPVPTPPLHHRARAAEAELDVHHPQVADVEVARGFRHA